MHDASPRTDEQLIPFLPAPWLPGGDLQTLAGYLLPGPKEIPDTRLHEIALADGDRLVLCENRPAQGEPPQGAVLLMHGLGGKADSPYMVRIGDRFWRAGWCVFRLNHRGAGQGVGLARQIYHSGRSEDVPPVLRKIDELFSSGPLVVVGFSLSGNILLKYLGETGETAPARIAAAIAVNPPIRLARSAVAFARRRNRLYDIRFNRLLRQALAERRQAFADFPDFAITWRTTLYEFDEIVTAPLNQFQSAADYYEKCSAAPLLADIRRPAIVLASDDDPFVPADMFGTLPENPNLRLILTRSGGHMGFIAARPTTLGDRRWLDYALLQIATQRITGYRAA